MRGNSQRRMIFIQIRLLPVKFNARGERNAFSQRREMSFSAAYGEYFSTGEGFDTFLVV